MAKTIPISNIKTQILKRLKEKSMSIYALEKKAAIGTSSVRNILNGQSKEPQISTLQAIAEALDCSVLDLISENNPQTTEHDSQQQDLLASNILDLKLLEQTFATFKKLCESNNYNPSSGAALFVIKEIYYYSLREGDTKVDEKFAAWIIETNCRKR